jgi:dTDP-4-amino-4,6-dideoxygalactose transaminase
VSVIAPIGGFFERHDPEDAAVGASVLETWTGGRAWAGFVNARSAFAALVESLPGVTIWLPAYVCSDLVDPSFAGRVRFYPVGDGFLPDIAGVEAGMAAGDLVLVVAYFGEPVAEAVEAFARRRPDLRIVEDRAQALHPGPAAEDRWVLYSPRKLLGVADGGLLVAPAGASTVPQPSGLADGAALWRAADLRHDDPAGWDNAVWHAANREKEAAMAVTAQAMTARSLSILSRTSLESLAGPRRANWRVLDRRLRRWSALPGEAKAPPLGYVIRLEPEERDRVLSGLHAERIFAAVHWPQIAAPATDFPREYGWTRELITLPCDHRYDAAEMARVADRVEALLA